MVKSSAFSTTFFLEATPTTRIKWCSSKSSETPLMSHQRYDLSTQWTVIILTANPLLKSSRNKKDLNDITAAPFLLGFFADGS